MEHERKNDSVKELLSKVNKQEKELKKCKSDFLQQIMAQSFRCTNAIQKAKTALTWNAVNTILILIAILIYLLS